jgi:hypothetical protein
MPTRCRFAAVAVAPFALPQEAGLSGLSEFYLAIQLRQLPGGTIQKNG